CLYLIAAVGFDINGDLARTLGRDPTLTDRTFIWKIVLGMHTNPLVGTGYESFWLGPRLKWIWNNFSTINEAHNGYLEIYLSLGLIGLTLLVGLLLTSYRSICKMSSSDLPPLSLAIWTVSMFYNITESAFKFHPMWFFFLIAAINVPECAEGRLRASSVIAER